MKYPNKTLLLLINIVLLSCSKQDNYTITKISVRPETLYSQEAKDLVGKKINLTFYDNSAKLTIEGQEPIFLKDDGHNQSYERTHNNLDYHLSFGGSIDNKIYSMDILKDSSGDKFLEIAITKHNSLSHDTVVSGSGLSPALINSNRNQIVTKITAKP